mgnify:CR=1 FL=1
MISLLLTLLLTFPSYANASEAKSLFIIGDSLTEGYGVEKEKAFPALVEKKFSPAWKIVNSGISGSTSASAAARVKWVLRSNPHSIMLALGANDGLRGLPPEEMEKNLGEAIALAKGAKVEVYLAGMLAPPNMGKTYTKKFESSYVRLAKKHKIALMPFLLKDVAGNPKLNLSDGIHPNEEGHAIVATNVAAFFEKNGFKPNAEKK